MNNYKTRKSKCSGCISYEMTKTHEDYAPCSNIPFIKDYECPCISCLIKGMCNAVCEPFLVYIEWIYDNYPHMLVNGIIKYRKDERGTTIKRQTR